MTNDTNIGSRFDEFLQGESILEDATEMAIERIDNLLSAENAYEALGFPNADQMQLKATIASGIVDILKKRRLSEADASSLLGTSQSELASILRGQFRKIPIAKMMGYRNFLESIEK